MQTSSESIRTHIPVLDELLGFTSNPSQTGVISPGSIVIIRGEPGCGKTTLGLQILSSYLKNNPAAWGGYLSLEKDPEQVFAKMSSDFDMFGDIRSRTALLSANDVQNLLRFVAMDKKGSGVFDVDIEKYVRKIAENVLGVDSAKGVQSGSTELFRDVAVEAIVDLVRYWKGRAGGDKEKRQHIDFERRMKKVTARRNPTNSTNLIFLDSINAFIRILRVSLPSSDPRVLVKVFCDALQAAFGKMVIVASSEASRGTDYGADSMSESYLCDVEILLRTEPVAVAKGYMGEYASPVGYSIAKVREDLESGRNQVESRPFCRVVKSRDCAHESRRCSYEIVPGEGLRFYETYPGDGKLVMFSENDSQQKCWEDFAKRDLPNCYPGLRYEIFHRQNLQTVYEGQRRLRNIPVLTDLYMSSIDSYWVHWFCEFKLKAEITEIVDRVLFGRFGPKSEQRAMLVNSVVHFARHAIRGLEGNTNPANLRNRISTLCGSTAESSELLTAVEDLVRSTRWTYLVPIDTNQMLLYGERNSKLIKAIAATTLQTRPTNKQKDGSLLAVPYDANVGFLVARTDLLATLRTAWIPGPAKSDKEEPICFASLNKIAPKIAAIGHAGVEDEDMNTYFVNVVEALFSLRNCSICDAMKDKNVIAAIDEMNRDSLEPNPAIAEELVETCENRLKPGGLSSFNDVLGEAAKRIVAGEKPWSLEELLVISAVSGHSILIETLTFDTFLCFWWELVWNCGGDIVVHGDYSVEKKPESFYACLSAVFFIYTLFRLKCIPENSSVEAEKHQPPKGDWIIARHWYSTLIDLLTKPKPRWQQRSRGKDLWAWKPEEGTQLDIIPFPIAIERLAQRDHNHQPIGRSALGHWSLAVLDGSENKALGVDLVNNLMGSQKVTERAFFGAAVPTVEEFYSDYGDSRCVNFPERADPGQPKTTWNDLKKIIENAKTRTDIYDYRHSARVFHSLLKEITSAACKPDSNPSVDLPKLAAKFFHCVSHIESFYKSTAINAAPRPNQQSANSGVTDE